MRGLQPLRAHGEQRHAFPARSILRGRIADADLAVLQAGIPSRSTAEQNGPPGAPVFFLFFWYNHGSDYFKIMDAETERVVHSRDVTWHQPRKPLISLASTVGSGVPHLSSGVKSSDYVYVQPIPAATAMSAAAPATTELMPASPVAAPAPLPNP